jgi:hypothetical protein
MIEAFTKSGANQAALHKVKLKTVTGKRRRFDDATTDFLSDAGQADILIWLGHARAGSLSGHQASGGGPGTYIGLQDIITTISIVKPKVVNFLACEFGIFYTPAKITASTNTDCCLYGRASCDAAGGPYACVDAPRWIAKNAAGNGQPQDGGERLKNNGDDSDDDKHLVFRKPYGQAYCRADRGPE